MVGLLEKLWGTRASPARSHGSHPVDGRYRKASYRPQLEPLEDRLTPSGLVFFPIAHVAVNPQPLPPGGPGGGNEISFPGVYLEEVPLVTNPIIGVSTQTEHLAGFLTKQ